MGTPLRVLHVTSSFPRHRDDAVGPFLLTLAAAQVEAGHEVSVLAPHDPGAPLEEVLDGVEVRRFRYAPGRLEALAYRGGLMTRARSVPGAMLLPGFLAAFAVAARRRVSSWRPDVVHAHWWLPAGLVGALACGGRDVPLVVSLHGSDVHLAERRPFGGLARAVLGRAAVVATVSEALAADRFEVARMPIRSINPSVAPPPSPPLRLLSVGRLSEEKGLDVAIEAIATLVGEGLDVRLVVVGDGPLDRRLRAQAGPLGERVEFVGACAPAELDGHYDAAHALVVPSRREGLGLVAVEALSRGRRVVASRVGGLVETLQGTEAGVLVPPGDPAALADALRNLPAGAAFEPPEAVARHSAAAVVEAHAGLYEAALSGCRR
ncbi:MAG: glycosyltransferase [Acidimicrobiales bacterium]